MKQNRVFIYGRHAVGEALQYAPKALTKVFVDTKAADKELLRLIDKAQIPVAKLSEGLAKSDMRAGAAHQGIIGAVSVPQLVVPFPKFLEHLSVTPDSALVLFNGVQDPHNVGAIIRSAAGLGASAVLMPERGQAPITGAVLKVSAGMAFRLPLVQVGGVKEAILELKKRGCKVYALAGDAKHMVSEAAFGGPTVFLVGNEGAGISKDIRALCDAVLAIPMHPRAESLNVAASAAVALFAWATKHPGALRA